MSRKEWALRGLIWLGLAIFLAFPASLSPGSLLVGHPDVDLWNHAWGYWYIPHQLSAFGSPFSTELVGAPDGGLLYFIDMLGALIGTPIAWVFGPAVAFNMVMVLRLALAGLAAQLLTETLTGRGVHSWLAGAAFASMPFLLSEIGNGISEVATVHWLAWTLWAAQQVREDGSAAAWRKLGLLQGLCTVANFYYGFLSGLMVVVVLGWDGARGLRAGMRVHGAQVRRVLGAVGIALLVSLPFWALFQWTLHADGALIVRDSDLASGWMLVHNAVDPRTFFAPFDFQSVDLAQYGEAFRHTGYLRWSLLMLAISGAMGHKKLRPWLVAGVVSGLLGLGPFLWWGEHVTVAGRHISLPFYWLQGLLPDLAITHTLRLALGAQLMVAVFGAAGLLVLARRVSVLQTTLGVAVIATVVVAESVLVSPAEWPIPTASAEVHDMYEDLGSGPILDLPGGVGTTMATSRYFWYQTLHGRPIPYTPNARMDSCRDLDVAGAFTNPKKRSSTHEIIEDPGSGPKMLQASLAVKYAAIVLHTDLEARAKLPSAYGPVLTGHFGSPTRYGDKWVWKLRRRSLEQE